MNQNRDRQHEQLLAIVGNPAAGLMGNYFSTDEIKAFLAFCEDEGFK